MQQTKLRSARGTAHGPDDARRLRCRSASMQQGHRKLAARGDTKSIRRADGRNTSWLDPPACGAPQIEQKIGCRPRSGEPSRVSTRPLAARADVKPCDNLTVGRLYWHKRPGVSGPHLSGRRIFCRLPARLDRYRLGSWRRGPACCLGEFGLPSAARFVPYMGVLAKLRRPTGQAWPPGASRAPSAGPQSPSRSWSRGDGEPGVILCRNVHRRCERPPGGAPLRGSFGSLGPCRGTECLLMPRLRRRRRDQILRPAQERLDARRCDLVGALRKGGPRSRLWSCDCEKVIAAFVAYDS